VAARVSFAPMALLVPELDVSDLDVSLAFYEQSCGFEAVYARPEERFVYLALGGAELMLQQAAGPGRRFRTAPLQRPFGRGVNLQIEVEDVTRIWQRCLERAVEIVVPIEERSYRAGSATLTSRQFVAADPDGYLLRFFTDIPPG
jgi:catechol 2,3-dioxygenase-like lactoylglutathione lyase family enzyme